MPEKWRDGNLAAAYAELLADQDPAVREKAARDWCEWEDTHVRVRADQPPDPRYDDPVFRMTFARLVTHYWSHAAFLDDDALQRGTPRLAGIPAELIHGRLDVSSPLQTAWELAQAWPGSRLRIAEGEGHGGGSMSDLVVAATDAFGSR